MVTTVPRFLAADAIHSKKLKFHKVQDSLSLDYRGQTLFRPKATKQW